MRRGWDRGSVVCRGISPSAKSVNIYHFCVDGVGGWYRKRGWFCIARWSQSRWDRSCSRDECCICICFCVCIENQCCLFVVFRWESSCGCWYKLLTKQCRCMFRRRYQGVCGVYIASLSFFFFFLFIWKLLESLVGIFSFFFFLVVFFVYWGFIVF